LVDLKLFTDGWKFFQEISACVASKRNQIVDLKNCLSGRFEFTIDKVRFKDLGGYVLIVIDTEKRYFIDGKVQNLEFKYLVQRIG
jgi:hypothetical protein